MVKSLFKVQLKIIFRKILKSHLSSNLEDGHFFDRKQLEFHFLEVFEKLVLPKVFEKVSNKSSLEM